MHTTPTHARTHVPTPPTKKTRPFENGEVATQPYNSLLSLGSLVRASDAVLLLQNEALERTCGRLLGIARPGLEVAVCVCVCVRRVCERVCVCLSVCARACALVRARG